MYICIYHTYTYIHTYIHTYIRIYRLVHIGKSQPAKNRNLSRLISNLSRLKKKTYCLPRDLPCLVFESSNTFLTYT